MRYGGSDVPRYDELNSKEFKVDSNKFKNSFPEKYAGIAR